MLSVFSDEMETGPVAAAYKIAVAPVQPVMACPSSPGNVKPVAQLVGIAVSQVVIGSCTNGRLSDMREAAAVFRHGKVHPKVNCIVLPASRTVVEQMEAEGLSQVFRDAGAVVTNPGCGPCFGGHMGLITADDTVVATSNRNFPGRMGAKEGKVYLASPRAAAETAVAGSIVSPGTVAPLGGN